MQTKAPERVAIAKVVVLDRAVPTASKQAERDRYEKTSNGAEGNKKGRGGSHELVV